MFTSSISGAISTENQQLSVDMTDLDYWLVHSSCPRQLEEPTHSFPTTIAARRAPNGNDNHDADQTLG